MGIADQCDVSVACDARKSTHAVKVPFRKILFHENNKFIDAGLYRRDAAVM
jgi:hypothetical protein